MPSDIFTKNCDGATFGKHLPKFVGYDEYMEHDIHKGRVPEAKDCEYREGTYMAVDVRQCLDKYYDVMSTLVSN
eukprot:5369731-Ditylum_brightwellii.AAC.1